MHIEKPFGESEQMNIHLVEICSNNGGNQKMSTAASDTSDE
jgi:hypothetical protein